ncbi:DUF7848 domain-containing protein [Streptomyces sp. DSM 40750]|uniref:DUF7848 domain-containing protein n=1 Tax=Streptomyces sp. DSM 40750 TaxID=2801030 RepID=UPI00214B4559|nr:hypothetical protein [Streptomyces sp. DSM 40750]UUU23559.1 hypothetical protein JIX55_26695 [Streptomyces sp. DSM 40750]
MTRSIIKAADWTLAPETAEGTPQGTYSAVCLTCGAESPTPDSERLPAEVWALKHTGLHPRHRQFKARTETFWRVTPAEGNPHRETDPRSAQAPA